MGNGGEKVSWKRVLILAGAVIAFTIGSGFATVKGRRLPFMV